MASYEFLTAWILDAPREDVWDALWESERWPEWWRGVVEATEIDPGTPCGIGRRGTYAWRSRIPYPVRFEVVSTMVERPHALAGDVSGELEGTGCWSLLEDDGNCVVIYDWRIRTTKLWMNAAAPIARPVFKWNHDRVMRWGGEGIAKHLGCRLVAAS